MLNLTQSERAEAYRSSALGQRFPASVPWVGTEQGREVLYAIWLIGNDYRNPSKYYGAYPKGYLDRVAALFPDMTDPRRILHAFSGSLPSGPYVRCDSVQGADLSCDIIDLPTAAPAAGYDPFEIVLADPPYSSADAEKYGTKMINRGKVTRTLAQVTAPGGFLCWLDTCWPMHNKRDWVTVGRIYIQRSTNHRVRKLTIFRRVAPV